MFIKYLQLPRNELDCGDCVYIADIFTHQPTLLYADLSFNRIGSRGMTRMCKALKDNKTIHTFRIDHNIVSSLLTLFYISYLNDLFVLQMCRLVQHVAGTLACG